MSTDIHLDLRPDKEEMADRLNRLIGTLDRMKEDRLNKIRSLPNSLHGSPALEKRHKVPHSMTTSTIINRTQPEQANPPVPSGPVLATKRVLFSPDSDSDDGSPLKPTSYLPSPDPPPLRSPSVTRNPLYDSPDPFLTGEPGNEITREAVQVQSLAGMIPPTLDLSPSHAANGADRQVPEFLWPMDQPPNDWMVKILLELKGAVSSLQESQAQIMQALEKQPLSPFSRVNDITEVTSRGIHFLTSEEGGHKQQEQSAGTPKLKTSRTFRIVHDAKGVQREEIGSRPISRCSSKVMTRSSSSSLIHLSSNEEKLKMERAASIIQVWSRVQILVALLLNTSSCLRGIFDTTWPKSKAYPQPRCCISSKR